MMTHCIVGHHNHLACVLSPAMHNVTNRSCMIIWLHCNELYLCDILDFIAATSSYCLIQNMQHELMKTRWNVDAYNANTRGQDHSFHNTCKIFLMSYCSRSFVFHQKCTNDQQNHNFIQQTKISHRSNYTNLKQAETIDNHNDMEANSVHINVQWLSPPQKKKN